MDNKITNDKLKKLTEEVSNLNPTDFCKVMHSFTRDIINRLQAENERLENILICFMGALGKVRNIDDIESISQIPIMTELNKGIRAEIKAEAYKECIEKAKSEINSQSHSRSLEASGERFRIHKILDDLLKELEGENK